MKKLSGSKKISGLAVISMIFFFFSIKAAGAVNNTLTPKKGGLFTLSLEELVNFPVISATKSAVKLSEAPASLYVITRNDIDKYGYFSLEQALARVPEVYVHFNGHNYSADFRGFFLNNNERRVLYLLDGHKINDRFHFGDQYPDILSEISNVERIEVMRGPGAALYGDNSILGVVNIITEKPEIDSSPRMILEATELWPGSYIQKYQFVYQKKFSTNFSISANISWFQGQVDYDTETNWTSTEGRNGRADYFISTDVYFSADNSTGEKAFETGKPLPNWHIDFQCYDFTIGSFLYSKRTSWVWPKDRAEFNHPDNDRQWSTGSWYVKYHPKSKYDLSACLSYNIHTNREIAAWTENSPSYKASDRLGADVFLAGEAFLMGPDGNLYDYVESLFGSDPGANAALQTEAINANGGGTQFVYHGIDRTGSFDFQVTPFRYQEDLIVVMTGGNFNVSHYDNYQRYTYSNNRFIGWAGWGGISDEGYNIGLWTQALLHPFKPLTFTAGLRYDYQRIQWVQQQLGGEQLYRSDGSAIRFEDGEAEEVTPRVAMNWRLNDSHSFRLLYGEAFRAVAAQEVARLPLAFGQAESEKTRNIEGIYSGRFFDEQLGVCMNLFYLKGDIIYQWDPTAAAFYKGRGWDNLGGSFEIKYVSGSGFEAWVNGTFYRLNRPISPYIRKLEEFAQSTYPQQNKAIDSPTILLKGGMSYSFQNYITAAVEIFHNNPVTELYANKAGTALAEYDVPSSTIINLILSKRFDFGLHLQARLENIFDVNQWGVLTADGENFAPTYEAPHQIPEFGRSFSLRATYEF